jgi:hypothetical protein
MTEPSDDKDANDAAEAIAAFCTGLQGDLCDLERPALSVEMSLVAALLEYGERIDVDFRDEELGELERFKLSAFDKLHFLDGVLVAGEATFAGMVTAWTCAYSDSEGLVSARTTS